MGVIMEYLSLKFDNGSNIKIRPERFSKTQEELAVKEEEVPAHEGDTGIAQLEDLPGKGVADAGFLQADVRGAVGVVLRNAVLAVQQSPADRVPTVTSDIDGVLCKADVVWQFLVTDASRLDQQSEVQILAVL